jgi:RNA polymerase sigma-70 factor, ECF subfamily
MLEIFQSPCEERTAMLRLVGSVIGPWVEELRGVCSENLSNGKEVILDFTHVSSLDAEGISLVLTLRDQAVSIRNIPLPVAEQLRNTVQSAQHVLDDGSTTPRFESRTVKASRSMFSGPADELDLIAALRSGDEAAFAQLVDTYQNCLLRTARIYVSSHAVAEEVVQETWLGVLKGLESFEGLCSLKTWIFQILINRAKTRGKREGRMIPFSAMFDHQSDPNAPAVDSRLFNDHCPQLVGGWVSPPRDWGKTPEQALLSQEFRALVQTAIDALPPSQKEVITLRDVHGWTPGEVCDILRVSETNQRVLLHRARSKVRQALEHYFATR